MTIGINPGNKTNGNKAPPCELLRTIWLTVYHSHNYTHQPEKKADFRVLAYI